MEMVSGGQAIPPALGLLVALPTRQVDKTKLPIGHCPGGVAHMWKTIHPSGALC